MSTAAVLEAAAYVEKAERMVIAAMLVLDEVGLEIDPVVAEMVAELIDALHGIAEGRMVPAPAEALLPSYLAKVAQEYREECAHRTRFPRKRSA